MPAGVVVQLIQGTQKHADAALIQKRHLLRVLELDAGDIRPQLTAVQCGQQSVQDSSRLSVGGPASLDAALSDAALPEDAPDGPAQIPAVYPASWIPARRRRG